MCQKSFRISGNLAKAKTRKPRNIEKASHDRLYMQSEDGLHVIYEIDARKMYRKWDNIKCIAEKVTSSPRPRKVYESGMWGISIKTKERTASEARVSLPFGIVVTLKEMYGKNRIDDFIKLCQARGWLVNNIDIQNRLDVYAQAEEEIHL